MAAISARAPLTCRAVASSRSAQPVQMLGQSVHDGQRGVDLQPARQRQLLVDDGLQRLAGAADHAGLAQRRGALVEAGRVDALRPPGVLDPQVVVELQRARHSSTCDGGM